MRTIVLTDGSGRWFDADSAKVFGAKTYLDTASGIDISFATQTLGAWDTLYLTPGGMFVLVRTHAGYRPEAEGAVEMDLKSAVAWLISYGHKDALKKLDLASEEAALEI